MLSQPSTRTAKPQAPRRWGGALVEFAVMAPFLCLLTFGMLEAAQAMRLRQSLSEAGRKGARTAAMPNASSATIETEVKNALTEHGIKAADVEVMVYVNDQIAEAKNAQRGDKISVRIAVKLGQALWFMYLMNKDATAAETLVMMRQG